MSTFEEQLVAEYFKHFITNNLNLGQYKSELWCKCGDKLIVDGHARDWHSITEEVFYRHVADKQAAAHQSELDLAVKEASWRSEALDKIKANDENLTPTPNKDLDSKPLSIKVESVGGEFLDATPNGEAK